MLGYETGVYSRGSAPWSGIDTGYSRADPYAETYNTPEEIDYCTNHCPLSECVDCFSYHRHGLVGKDYAEELAKKEAKTEHFLVIAIKDDWSDHKLAVTIGVSDHTASKLLMKRRLELVNCGV